MDFDAQYFNDMYAYFNSNNLKEDEWYFVSDYTDEPEKFLYHAKYYIDHKIEPEHYELEFSDDFKKFRILEFFVGIEKSWFRVTGKPLGTGRTSNTPVPIPQVQNQEPPKQKPTLNKEVQTTLKL